MDKMSIPPDDLTRLKEDSRNWDQMSVSLNHPEIRNMTKKNNKKNKGFSGGIHLLVLQQTLELATTLANISADWFTQLTNPSGLMHSHLFTSVLSTHTHKKLNPTHFQECLEFRNMSYILKSCWGVSPWTTSVGDELAEAKNKHNGTEVQSFFFLIYNLQTEHEEKLILDIRPDNSCNFV